MARTLPERTRSVRTERDLLDVGVRVGVVQLEEVDVIDPEAAQGLLDLVDDPAAGAAGVVGARSHGTVDLGGDDDVVAASLQGTTQDLLGGAAGVDVGAVDEVDPGIHCGVDDPDAVVNVDVAAVETEHHCAQAVRADFDAGASERAHLHEELSLGLLSSRQGGSGEQGDDQAGDHAADHEVRGVDRGVTKRVGEVGVDGDVQGLGGEVADADEQPERQSGADLVDLEAVEQDGAGQNDLQGGGELPGEGRGRRLPGWLAARPIMAA
jgi:hypothetical protein